MYVVRYVSFVFFMFILKKTKIETFLLKNTTLQTTMDMEQFLARHNIGNETFENLVEESSDYGPSFKRAAAAARQLEQENEELKKENEKLKEQLETANEYCASWGYHWDAQEEVYVNEDVSACGVRAGVCVDYKDDDVKYYIDGGRIAVLKDGREVMSKDDDDGDDDPNEYYGRHKDEVDLDQGHHWVRTSDGQEIKVVH